MPILIAFLLLPLVEIVGFVVLGPYLGVSGTLTFVLASMVLGASLLRNEGLGLLRRLQHSIASGATPVPAALDGACRIIAALLLIVPGFFSTVAGLLLLVPPLRRLVVQHLRARVRGDGGVSWRFGRAASTTLVIDADYQEVGESRGALPPRRHD